MDLTIASIADVEPIQIAAEKAFYATYLPFIAAEQVDYMYRMMYSKEALIQQMNNRGDVFILARDNDQNILGFAAWQRDYSPSQCKLHKLYVLPENQGRQMGATLLHAVERMALNARQNSILLNVNRYNKAVYFYQKMGYKILREEDIDIGSGFYMNDYEMIKSLSNTSNEA